MKLNKKITLIFLLITTLSKATAQEESPAPEIQPVLSRANLDKSAPAVVKIVADEGRKIGAGVILGIHNDGVGFILTSYSLIAGRDKVAVIVKDYPDPLLGRVVDRWIDFDSDLAIVGVKNFPATAATITLGEPKSARAGSTVTLIAHTDDGDWQSIPIQLSDANERYFVFNAADLSNIDGSPLVDQNGSLIGLVLSDELLPAAEQTGTQAIKTSVIKPLVKEWFRPVALQKKWRESRGGFATWIWAVGGGVIGGTTATVIALAGGGEEAPRGLPRPPEPPATGN